MANIAVDTSRNPWIITTIGGALTLPHTIVGPQGNPAIGNPAGLPYGVMPRRIRWVSPSAVAGDTVILQDVPPNGGTPRTVYQSQPAQGGQFGPPEDLPLGRELYQGLQVTQFDSGTLFIWL